MAEPRKVVDYNDIRPKGPPNTPPIRLPNNPVAPVGMSLPPPPIPPPGLPPPGIPPPVIPPPIMNKGPPPGNWQPPNPRPPINQNRQSTPQLNIENQKGIPLPMLSVKIANSETSEDISDETDKDDNKEKSEDESDESKEQREKELIFPKALEDALALKDIRAADYQDGNEIFTVSEDFNKSNIPSGVISTDYADAEGDSDEDDIQAGNKESIDEPQNKKEKNKRKKKRKKLNRKARQNAQREFDEKDEESSEKNKENKNIDVKEGKSDEVVIEYVPERITVADLAPMYRQFYRIFEIFKLESKPKTNENEKTGTALEQSQAAAKNVEKLLEEEDDDMEIEKSDDKEKLSKRKLKKLTRLSVAELKQLVARPDVVEMHDVTARDPKLLVQLKAHRNTVQVPRHWCFKRKYLQGKRGIEKPPFDLPAFIKKTGIMEMRESLQEKDDAKTLKAKMRERARPKMGKIDIDYQKLHDAFFKWQTKPKMSIHGDLYYEGKEYETRLKEKKPGDLSEELRIALGMPVGPNCHKIPPPWLIAQQRYGPPPSYPNLKIPGLNAPIPEGCSFGYHAGGWGKPPVDENGKPLYGDVFGTNIIDLDSGIDEGDIERNQWGELESESEESSEEEEEEEGEDLVNGADETGLVTPAEGLVTPSGLTSIPAGMETPENIELRKKKIEAEMEDNETPVLYQVLPEKHADRVGASMMGSTHIYDISGVNKMRAPPPPPISTGEGMVELALDPSELDLDNDAMAQRYEQQMREQQSHLQKEDLSDMLAEHVARQKSKRKRQQTDTTKTNKKYKEFKF